MKKKFALVLVIVLALTILTSVLVACSSVTITFDSNGGKALETSTYKKTVENEPIPERDGYDFQGWNTAKDGKGDKISFETPYSPSKSITLYAQWTEKDIKDDVVAKILALMVDDIVAPGSDVNNIAWNFELDAFSTTGTGDVKTTTTYRLSSKTNISKDTPEDTAIGFSLEEVNGNDVKTIFSIVVDNSNIYMEANGGEFQRNFKGFELGEVLKVKHFEKDGAIAGDIGLIETIFGLLIGMLFQDATLADNGDAVLTGTADNLVEMLPTIVAFLGEYVDLGGVDLVGIINSLGLAEALDGTVFTLKANINDFKGANITAVKKGSFDAGIELRKAEFAAKETALVVPVKQELKDLPAINIANFTLEGRFSLVNQRADYTFERTTFTYELRTNLDPFSVMEIQEDGSVKANINNLFNEGGMFWFDVFHDCRTHGGKANSEFCSTRHANSNATGSILTLAFDPSTFGNNNINLSVNAYSIIYADLLDDLIGVDITSFGDYIGISIPPESLFSLFSPADAKASTMASESADLTVMSILPTLIELLSNLDYSKNYIELVGDILGIVGGFKFDDNGVNIDNLDSIFSILDNFVDLDINGMKLSTLLSNLFTQDVNEIEISVDNIEFADLNNLTFPAGAKFVFTNEYDGEYKDYGDMVVAVDSEWTYSKDIYGNANLDLYGGENIITTDNAGKAVPISSDEAEDLLNGSIYYNAIMPDGSIKKSTTKIQQVVEGPPRDADGNILAGRHKVKIVTGMTDGGAIEGLLGLIKDFGPMLGINIDITIPGHTIEGYITVTDTVGEVEWSQDSNYDSVNFDPDKTYTYGDKLNPFFNATLEYDFKQPGSDTNYKKDLKVEPYVEETNLRGMGLFYNYGTITNSEFRAFGTTNFVYSACGSEHKITVNMPESYMTKMDGNTASLINAEQTADQAVAVELAPNVVYTFGNNGNYSFKYNAGEAFTETSGVYPYRFFIFDEQENLVVTDRDAIMFTKDGEYILSGTAAGAPFKMKFQVGKATVDASMPKYDMLVSGTNSDGYIPVSFTRPGNILDGVGFNVKFDLSINDGTKLAADQFAVYVMDGGEYIKADKVFLQKYIAAYAPQQFFIKLADNVVYDQFKDSIKVTATATDTEYAGSIIDEVDFAYNFSIKNGGIVELNSVNGLRIQLLAGSKYSNITVDVVVNGEAVTGLKWLKVKGMKWGDTFLESAYAEAINYVPSFDLEAAYGVINTDTTALPLAITWDGLTGNTQYTITVKAADGTVLATVTNIPAEA